MSVGVDYQVPMDDERMPRRISSFDYSREDAIGEEVDTAEESEDYPVSEPLCIIFFVRSLNSCHGPIGRQSESNEVADEGSEMPDDHVNRREKQQT